MRNFEMPGRSEAFGTKGMAATSVPQATLVALDVLKTGGNAIDATIAAAAMLAVIEPTQTGIGGDCFALIKRRNQKVVAINGSGWSPLAADPDRCARVGGLIDPRSADAVTVPGALRAWHRLWCDFGSLPWEDLFRPAIAAAQDGYPVTERLARDWALQIDKLAASSETAEVFLQDGKAPAAGAIVRNSRLAKALASIATDGPEVFYEGWIAEDIVSTLRALGGVHSLEDFRDYCPAYVEPISTEYRGYRIWECPPSGQGIIVLAMANVLSRFDVAAMDPLGPERLHLLAEVARLAYAERDLLVADPAFGPVPVSNLLSPERADRMAASIRFNARLAEIAPIVEPPHKDTTYLTVVDREGTAVSFINSIFDDFGSGIMARDSGILLHNRACGFVLDRANVNCLEGRKRPMHTIIPAIVTKNDEAFMTLGVTGAHFQPIGQIQVLSNVIDYGMTVQAAIDHPRVFAHGDVLHVESTIPETCRTALAALGHKPEPAPHPLGTAQAIRIEPTGLLRGGADPRRDGVALGY
ncbi:gamma-glutamyltransferase [Azospirillum brasilense]|nr:gamma-glutamyltransferase [Azospirillum brasilense]NUB35461.1 gamma-glutamyltransferase [Azospirillum brasilense]RIV97757.1 gamma-glutamyltransferase [Azospirillum brasilense]